MCLTLSLFLFSPNPKLYEYHRNDHADVYQHENETD